MTDFNKNETITCYNIDGKIVAKFNPGEPVTCAQLFYGIPDCVTIRGHNRQGNVVQTIRRETDRP